MKMGLRRTKSKQVHLSQSILYIYCPLARPRVLPASESVNTPTSLEIEVGPLEVQL